VCNRTESVSETGDGYVQESGASNECVIELRVSVRLVMAMFRSQVQTMSV